MLLECILCGHSGVTLWTLVNLLVSPGDTTPLLMPNKTRFCAVLFLASAADKRISTVCIEMTLQSLIGRKLIATNVANKPSFMGGKVSLQGFLLTEGLLALVTVVSYTLVNILVPGKVILEVCAISTSCNIEIKRDRLGKQQFVY